MGPASILVPRTHSAWNHLTQNNFHASNLFRKTCPICPIYTCHVNYPMEPHCVLQPVKCVSHENRLEQLGSKWGRRLFSCLAPTAHGTTLCKIISMPQTFSEKLVQYARYIHVMSTIQWSLIVSYSL